MGFLDKIKGSDANNIFLVYGTDDRSLRCFFYIQVDKTKRPLFDKYQKGQQIDLDDFGVILESGYGEPSDDIKTKMKEDYNYSDS